MVESTAKSRLQSPGPALARYTAPSGRPAASKPEQKVALAGQGSGPASLPRGDDEPSAEASFVAPPGEPAPPLPLDPPLPVVPPVPAVPLALPIVRRPP